MYAFFVRSESTAEPRGKTSKYNTMQCFRIFKINGYLLWALKDIIKGSMDSNIKWKLPGGTPPYTPCEEHNYPASLHREHKQFVYFVQGQNKCESLPAYKREKLFLGMLEGVHPQDALVLIDMINKQAPKGITRPIVEEAFPGLLTD